MIVAAVTAPAYMAVRPALDLLQFWAAASGTVATRVGVGSRWVGTAVGASAMAARAA